jgi:hypothetical protein
MSRREQLPRRPLRMHVGCLVLSLFGWLIPKQHREFKELLRENRPAVNADILHFW